MRKNIHKYLFSILIIFSLFSQNLNADVPHFVDFRFILNQSKAGKQAQDFLKKKLNDGIKKLQDQEKKVQEEEQKIIKQKKVLNAEEYKKQVTSLRGKVASLQKQRNNLIETVGNQRAKAKTELMKALNPIISDYMKEKKIRMVIDKKSVLLADERLDITKEIIEILNQKLKSIKLN